MVRILKLNLIKSRYTYMRLIIIYRLNVYVNKSYIKKKIFKKNNKK